MSSDPYQTLGISPAATLTEARAAYLKHVRVLHPDRFDPVTQKVEWELANQMLQEVNAAWKAIETGTASASTREATPAPHAQPPFTRPPRPSSNPPAPVAASSSDASYTPGEPITYSRVIGQVDPYSGQALACLALAIVGLPLIFSVMAPLLFVLAVTLGYMAKASIRKNRYRGDRIATVGLWTGYLGFVGVGILHLLAFHSQASPPPPSLTGANEHMKQLNDELAQLDNQEQKEVTFTENNLDSVLALLKVEAAGLQTKISEETKTLSERNAQYDLLKREMEGSSGAPVAVIGTTPEPLQNQVAEISAQISDIQSQLKGDQATLNERLALLQKPRPEQLSQLEAQISAQFDERRSALKQKLTQPQASSSK